MVGVDRVKHSSENGTFISIASSKKQKIAVEVFMKHIRIYLAFILVAAIAAGIVGCAVASAGAADLMDGIVSQNVSGKRADSTFKASMADFSIELLKKSITDGENSLISPLSVMLALAMTANGADGNTLTEMETLLGRVFR